MRLAPIGITRLGSGGLYVPATTPPPPNTDWEATTVYRNGIQSWDIRDYYRLPGDHAYTIPDGYYFGGPLTDAPHPTTTGKFGGYALFRGQTTGGVIVDLGYPGKQFPGNLATANGDMSFVGDGVSGNTSGIISCKFKFQNGVINSNARNVHFWYTEHTFPYQSWFAEPGYPGFSYHGTNDSMFLSYGLVSARFYGVYFHDVGTGPTLQNGVRNVYMRGFKIGAVNNGGRGDVIHPDGIAILGGNVWNNDFLDFDIQTTQGGLGMNNQNLAGTWNGGDPTTGNWISANSSNNNFARGWVHNCAVSGFQVNSFYKMDGSPTYNNGTLTDIHLWKNGTISGNQNSSAYQWVEQVDNNQLTYTVGQNPQPTRILYTATNSDSGVDASVNGTVLDPATAWQTTTGQGVDDVISYFAGLVPPWPM